MCFRPGLTACSQSNKQISHGHQKMPGKVGVGQTHAVKKGDLQEVFVAIFGLLSLKGAVLELPHNNCAPRA